LLSFTGDDRRARWIVGGPFFLIPGKAADAGDGVAVEDEAVLTVMSHADDSEVLVFDLP
jgi:hypothetical protein